MKDKKKMEMLTVNIRVKAVNVLLKMETENNEAETNDRELNQYISCKTCFFLIFTDFHAFVVKIWN